MQLPEKIEDTAPSGTTFTSLGSTERKINEIITYLEAKEEKERYENELILDRASNWARPAKENFHSETKEPLFKESEIDVYRNRIFIDKSFATRKEVEAAREALLKLKK